MSSELHSVIKKLTVFSKKEYGSRWYDKVAFHLAKNRFLKNYKLPKEISYILKKLNLKVIGVGASRVVLGYKDVVIKMYHKYDPDNYADYDKDQNKVEITNYNFIKKKYKDLTPILCPILENIIIKNKHFLIFPRVKVGKIPTKKQDELHNILSFGFSDLHSDNVGYFCGGLVIIDLNYGIELPLNIEKTITKLNNFKLKYSKYWNDFVTLRERYLKKYKLQYGLK